MSLRPAVTGETDWRRRPRRRRLRSRAPTPPEATPAPIADRDTAYRRLLDIVEFLRKDDPDNPVAYLLVRAYRIGEVYAPGRRPANAATEQPGPAREVRQALRHMVADERWEEALDQAEQGPGAGGRGGAGLDAHRYAIQAMEATDRRSAALGCRSLLRMFLRDFPDLTRAELDDGTAAADAKTRLGLESEALLAPAASRTETGPGKCGRQSQPRLHRPLTYRRGPRSRSPTRQPPWLTRGAVTRRSFCSTGPGPRPPADGTASSSSCTWPSCACAWGATRSPLLFWNISSDRSTAFVWKSGNTGTCVRASSARCTTASKNRGQRSDGNRSTLDSASSTYDGRCRATLGVPRANWRSGTGCGTLASVFSHLPAGTQ